MAPLLLYVSAFAFSSLQLPASSIQLMGIL